MKVSSRYLCGVLVSGLLPCVVSGWLPGRHSPLGIFVSCPEYPRPRNLRRLSDVVSRRPAVPGGTLWLLALVFSCPFQVCLIRTRRSCERRVEGSQRNVARMVLLHMLASSSNVTYGVLPSSLAEGWSLKVAVVPCSSVPPQSSCRSSCERVPRGGLGVGHDGRASSSHVVSCRELRLV